MSEPVVITLPWPDKRLSPNARVHWTVERSVGKAAKELAFWTACEAGALKMPKGEPLSVHVAFVPPNARRRDTDNMLASCKPALDGIASACGVDDSKWTLTIERRAPAKPGSVIVTLLPADLKGAA